MSLVKAAAQTNDRFSRTSERCMTSRIKRNQALVLLVAALATLGACAPLAEVREVNPKLGAAHGTLPQLKSAEQAIAEGQRLQRSDPDKAIGFYLGGLEATDTALRKDPTNPLVLRDYNFALSRVFSVIRDARLDPWTHPLHVTVAEWRRLRPHTASECEPALETTRFRPHPGRRTRCARQICRSSGDS